MIKIESITKELGEKIILDGISLDIAPGEIVAIMGPSGTGKTVLLKHIIGLMQPDKGRVLVNGVDISKLKEDDLLKVREEMGYLFQEGALYDFYNTFENVAFPLKEHTSMTPDQIQERVKEVLGMVDLDDVETKMPSELSGGMKKRVGLARAIVLKPKILLCDEPTSGLDPIRSRDISNLIRNVAKKINATTVFTSHDIANSFRIADKLVLINEGKIAAQGSKEQVMAVQEKFVQEFVYP